jgi:heme/copper-type cytochrome/quinol oxidase subunit 4
MASHFLMLVLYAVLVSIAFATLLRDTPREQFRLGAMMLAAFVVFAYAVGWLMYPLPI